FRAATTLGAKFAGSAEKQIDALAKYGYNIGLAFQIVDDILDMTENEKTLGKTSGIDIAQGKGYAIAHTNNGSMGNVAIAEDQADPMQTLKQKLLTGDAITEGYRQAQFLVEQAIDYLDVLAPSPAKDALTRLANLTIQRDH